MYVHQPETSLSLRLDVAGRISVHLYAKSCCTDGLCQLANLQGWQVKYEVDASANKMETARD